MEIPSDCRITSTPIAKTINRVMFEKMEVPGNFPDLFCVWWARFWWFRFERKVVVVKISETRMIFAQQRTIKTKTKRVITENEAPIRENQTSVSPRMERTI